MRLSKPLELEIYWKNGDACELEALGIKTTYIPETKLVTFYNIDYVSVGEPEGIGKETGFLSSGGEEYATPLTYDQLNAEVMKCM